MLDGLHHCTVALACLFAPGGAASFAGTCDAMSRVLSDGIIPQPNKGASVMKKGFTLTELLVVILMI